MIIHSVLCPVDFSETSRTALHTAARVVRHFGATLHVLFVEDPLLASTALLGAPVPSELMEELRTFVNATPDLDLPREPALHVVTGAAAEAIVQFATQEQIELIVMGTHGRTGVRDTFFGSTTARVLKRTVTPLLMVPGPDGPDRSRNLEGLGAILVLVDFQPAAAEAADVAARFASLVGASLVLVHVTPAVTAPVGWTSRVRAGMDSRTAAAHRCMCRAMAPLQKYGPVESVIVEGSVAGAAAALARSRHAGLIVMGLEGDALGSRPGSTAYGVISAAPVPVLAIPAHPPAGPETAADRRTS